MKKTSAIISVTRGKISLLSWKTTAYKAKNVCLLFYLCCLYYAELQQKNLTAEFIQIEKGDLRESSEKAKEHKLPYLSVPPQWWPPNFTGIICLPHISQCWNSSHKRKQMRVEQKCSRAFLSPESGTAKETEAYDRYVKSKNAGSYFSDKGIVSRSMPAFTGQFNGRPNITTLSLTRFSHVFFFVFSLESACVIMVSRDKCRPCGFGSIYVRLWHPNVSLASVYVCMFWSEWADNRALASPTPIAIQIHRLFSEAKNSVRRLPLTRSL